ncbi:MAG: hypothetical protein N4A49_00150 [Marinifilaceae bacterium]|jgi:hypothetical protein|nr:hypothetical protein [Marinifilaceae bacterium]
MKQVFFTLLFLLGSIHCFSQQLDYKPTVLPEGKEFYIQLASKFGTNSGVLDIKGNNDPEIPDGANVQVNSINGDRDQIFTFQKTMFPGCFEICSTVRPSSRITTAGNTKHNGDNVNIKEDSYTNGQNLFFTHIGDGKYKITTNFGMTLCVENKKASDGTNVYLWKSPQADCAEWYIIDVETKKIFSSNKIFNAKTDLVQKKAKIVHYPCKPSGKVIDSRTGKAIVNADITVLNTNIEHFKPHNMKTNYYGEFRFDEQKDIKYGYKIIINAPGYGSKWIQLHTEYKPEYTVYKLDPIAGGKAIHCDYMGYWKYQKIGSNYYYVDGLTKSDHEYFFPHSKFANSQSYINKLREKMGLANKKLVSDQEIYAEFIKVWNFWMENKRDWMNNRTPIVDKAYKYLYKSGNDNWPAIEQLAYAFDKYKFFVQTNCTGTTLSFTSLLCLTNIPRSKIAIEVMHPSSSPNGEHWSLILNLKHKWYWFDPIYDIKITNKNNIVSLPRQGSGHYRTPFKLYTVPGSPKLKVPLCSLY